MPEIRGSLSEKTFSLSRNGGIYYGGVSIQLDKESAFLFVGLGGSGADALLRIKDQIQRRMFFQLDRRGKLVADIPQNVGFLEIDTDRQVQGITYGTARFAPFGSEFCDISVQSIPDLIADVKRVKNMGTECWQWFDDDLKETFGAGIVGSGGIRQIGRMLFLNNIKKVISSIEGKIDALITGNPNINNLQICVFGGVSGGTGGGIVLDLAYVLRKIAKQKISGVTLAGYLLMPDVHELNGGKSQLLRMNGFSCLKELDYWMHCHIHEERYQQRFPNGLELNEWTAPFDFCHLFNASNNGEYQFNYAEVLESVAEAAFAYVTKSIDYGCCTVSDEYLSSGVSKIEIPYAEISALLAGRIFEKFSKGMFKSRPTEAEFRSSISEKLELTGEYIRTILYEKVRDVPRPNLDEQNYSFADVRRNDTPRRKVYEWLTLFQQSVVQQERTLRDALEDKLKEFIRSNLCRQQTGPVYLCYFMNSDQNSCLYHYLEDFYRHCWNLCTQCADYSEDLTEELQRAYRAVQNGGFTGRRRRRQVLRNYLACLDVWYQNEERTFLNKKIIEILRELQNKVAFYYKHILCPLRDVLMKNSDMFIKNAEKTKPFIPPLKLENSSRYAWEEGVVNMEQEFLKSLVEKVDQWMECHSDTTDGNKGKRFDKFLSGFLCEYFAAPPNLNMETVMSAELKNGERLEDYMKECLNDLIQKSYPMYQTITDLSGMVQESAVLFVPEDCPLLYKAVGEYLEAEKLSGKIHLKKSAEKNRLSLMKLSAGYPLYANAFLQKMAQAYKNNANSTGRHLRPEWEMLFPLPNMKRK